MHESMSKVLILKSKRKFPRYLIKLSEAEAGAAIRICDSVELEAKEIISAPKHCIKGNSKGIL
jgi:hypothetical protein